MQLLQRKMNLWIYYFAIAFLGVEVAMSVQSPVCGQFPASFLAVIDQNIDAPDAFIVPDPELTFFKEVLGFRDDAIQHTIEDAMKFFNETYGLDFSLAPPTDQNEYFYQNAQLSPFTLADDIDYLVTLNNWIQTGNTRSTCYRLRDGGFRATFSDDQLLHGSYGGAGGLPVDVTEFSVYGFYSIEVCDQSPVIIQFQSGSPVHQEPTDGAFFLNYELYSQVLGHGNAMGVAVFTPSKESDQFHLVARNAFTFPVD